jgi:hypothetical protein
MRGLADFHAHWSTEGTSGIAPSVGYGIVACTEEGQTLGLDG